MKIECFIRVTFTQALHVGLLLGLESGFTICCQDSRANACIHFFLACKLQEPFEKVCENNVLERFKFSKAFQMLFTYEDCA